MSNISPPVGGQDSIHVTQEAVDFNESGLSIDRDQTAVSDGKIELGKVVDSKTLSNNWSTGSISYDAGVTLQPNETLTEIRYELKENATSSANRVYIERVGSNLEIGSDSVDGSTGVVSLSQTMTTEYEYRIMIETSTSGFGQDVEQATVSYPLDTTAFSITTGLTGDADDDSFSDDNSSAYAFERLTATTDRSADAGEATVAFDPAADIISWDLATYQADDDSETVNVDIVAADGATLKSNISSQTDISNLSVDTEPQIKITLSRSDSANNPHVDYAARRFTR